MCLFSQICIIVSPLDRPFGANYVEIKKKKKIKLTSCISNYSRKMNISQAEGIMQPPWTKTQKPINLMEKWELMRQLNKQTAVGKITGP